MSERLRAYLGSADKCAWWDASGKCNKPPMWLVALGEGLCTEHEIMFQDTWDKRFTYKELDARRGT